MGGVTCTRTANSPNCYGYNNYSLTGVSVLRTAWYTNLASLTIGTDNHNTALYRGLWSGVQTTVAVVVYRIAGALRTYLYLYNDSNGPNSTFVAFGLPSWFELRVQRASGVGVSDGAATLYAGGGVYAALGEQILQLTGIPNYTSFGNDTRAVLGMHNMFATGTSVGGSLIVDEWIMRNDDTPILFGVSESTFSPFLPYLRRRRRV